MEQHISTYTSILRKPTALLPIFMSLTALTILLIHIALFGTAREADEGATAHLWQILMAGQLPIILFFAVKWLQLARREATLVLALQLAAAIAAIAPVYLLAL